MIFPANFADKLRSSILLSQVVSKKVKLKLKGKEYSGLCPFHNEKTPSFTVNDQKGFYHCFGCGAHGDVIGFLINSEGLTFVEAIKKLADDFSIEIPKVEFDAKKNDEIKSRLSITEEIKNFYQENLLSEQGKEAISYLRNRGISNDIIKKFQLGFAVNSYQSLINFLKKKSINESEFIETGVIAKNQQNNFYDKLRNRVIFPIFDIKGSVIAFGGRSLGDEMPKYLNSAETKLFKKNQTLYNLHNARKAVFDKGFAIIVEGYMDVISLSVFGFDNAVASLGTALSENHFKELFRFSDKIILCLDGDSAGIKAAARSCEIILPIINAKKNLFIATLPEKLDPDEYLKKYGARNFTEILQNAVPLSQSLCQFALLENKITDSAKISAEKKAVIETDLMQKIDLITDKTSKKHFSYFIKDWLYNLGKNNKNFEKKNSPKVSHQINPKFSNAQFTNYLEKNSENDVDKIQNKTIAISIIALIVRFPELIFFENNEFNFPQLNFAYQNLNEIKDLMLDFIEEEDASSEQILQLIEKKISLSDFKEIKKLVDYLKNLDFTAVKNKFELYLLKNSLSEINFQLEKIRLEAENKNTAVDIDEDAKYKEIFNYREKLKLRILKLEQENI